MLRLNQLFCMKMNSAGIPTSVTVKVDSAHNSVDLASAAVWDTSTASVSVKNVAMVVLVFRTCTHAKKPPPPLPCRFLPRQLILSEQPYRTESAHTTMTTDCSGHQVLARLTSQFKIAMGSVLRQLGVTISLTELGGEHLCAWAARYLTQPSPMRDSLSTTCRLPCRTQSAHSTMKTACSGHQVLVRLMSQLKIAMSSVC